MANADVGTAIRDAIAADPGALNDPDHLRALLHDVAPTLTATQVEQCVAGVRYRLPDLLRANAGGSVDRVANLFASRVGSLDAAAYNDVVSGYAAALGVQLQPAAGQAGEATVLEQMQPPPVVSPPPVMSPPPGMSPEPMPPPPAMSPPPYGYGQVPPAPPPSAWGPPPSSTWGPPPQPPKRGSKRTLIWAIVAVVVLGAGVAVAVVLASGGKSKSAAPPTHIPSHHSSSSSVVTSSTPPVLLSAPAALATYPRKTGVFLTWQSVGGAQSYAVLRDGQQVATVGSGTTSYDDRGANTATTHSYQIRAVDAAGQSGTLSTPVTSTTASVAINALIARIPRGLAAPGSCYELVKDEQTDSAFGGTEVKCTPTSGAQLTPNDMWVESFPATAQLHGYMDKATRGAPTDTTAPCQTSRRRQKGYWHFNSHKNQTVGQVYCEYNTSSNTPANFVWTYDDGAVLVWVDANSPIDRLYQWWTYHAEPLRS